MGEPIAKEKDPNKSVLRDRLLAELRERFRQCDAHKDGYLDSSEFVCLLDNLGADMSKPEADSGFQAIDSDNDQRIDFGEFAACWTED